MKIIDILNKIANGEEVPKKIKTPSGIVLTYDEDIKNYFGETTELFSSYVAQDLNIEVEIIEEDKKIEKIDEFEFDDEFELNSKEIDVEKYFNNLANKINEIIEVINERQKDTRVL